MAMGISLERQGARLIGRCPFCGDDNHFAVFGEELDRCGCWKCSFSNGDVFDLVARLNHLDVKSQFAQVLEIAKDLLGEPEGFGETLPRLAVQRVVAPAPQDLASLVARARAEPFNTGPRSSNAASALLIKRGFSLEGCRWLWEEFMLGELGEDVIAPYFADDGVTLLTYKRRRFYGGCWYACPGLPLSELYGVWRDKGHSTIFVCEGETDTWSAAWEYRSREIDVVGLPAGAKGPRKEWLRRFENRDVFLFFDGDKPGRDAAERWKHDLEPVAAAVVRVPMPRGTDVSDLRRGGDLDRRYLMNRKGM